MAFNIFSTLNQNLQNFGGDAYDAYQAGKSKVGNVASTINNNLQDFGGDIYDVGNTIKNNVSNFGTQTYNQGKNVASTIKKNVGDYTTGQINEIKAIPSQIGQGFDNFKQGARDLNYQAWNAGMKALTGKNNATFSDLAPNLGEEMSRNTGKADETKVMKFVEEIAKAGYNQDQAMEILQTTLAEQPDFFNKQTYGDKIRKTAVNRGREFGKTYQDFSTGKIGFGEATLRNAGDIVGLGGGVIGDTITQIPGVTPTLNAIGGAITSIPGVKPGMEAYGSFAQANPRAAQNIEAITNLGLSALGSTEGQALMKKGANVLGRKVAQGANYLDDTLKPITTPISNSVSKGVEKMKSIAAPINADEQILKDAGLKTVKGMVGDKVVEVPAYGVMDKARSFVAPADTKRLVNRALSPRGTGLGDKQKLASVVNAEKNVRNYHQLVRSGKLKGDLSSLESTAQSVVDNLDEVGSKIGKAVDKVQANVAISDDAYKAIDDAVGARGASRTPTAKILENFKEDTAGSMTLKEAFDIKKIYQTEVGKLIRSGDAGTPQYSALVKGVEELTNQIDNAIETQLKGSKFKELKSQYRLMKSMVGDITNSAMVEGRRSPQTFVEQLGTIEAMGNILSSPIATGRQFLAKEIGEMNTRGGSWRELIKRLDNEAVNAYKKSQTTSGKVIKREMENLPVATKPPIVPKAKPKATTESPFKNNKGFINPSEIKKSLVPKKGVDEARQFYDDLVYAGNSPIVAQRETAKRFGTIRAMSASKAGTFGGELAKAPPKDKTGWFKGADGKMRFEIDDSGAKLTDKWFHKTISDKEDFYYELSYGKQLEDLLDHPTLYKQYPELKNLQVMYDESYKPSEGAFQDFGDYIVVGKGGDKKSTLLHEIQHYIQSKEGFARGGSPSKSMTQEQYNSLAGEVEARNVQSRINLSAKERKLKSPESTEDVPRAKQIVRIDNKGNNLYIKELQNPKSGTMDMSKLSPDDIRNIRKNPNAKNQYVSGDFKKLSDLDSDALNRAIGTYDFENIPDKVKLYRGIKSNKDFDLFDGDFLTKNKNIAENFAGKNGRVKQFEVDTKDLRGSDFGYEEVVYIKSPNKK